MISERLNEIKSKLPQEVKLVAVSKFHPLSAILLCYSAGQRCFGESRPQEFASKAVQLPQDIEWHFIGHLQTNKLKLVLPYAHIVESIDSDHLLQAVNAWGEQNGKIINVLLEVHIGEELTKQGFSEEDVPVVLSKASEYPYCRFCGLMGMASHVDDAVQIEDDFARINALFASCKAQFPELESFTELSIGMSDDWPLALRHGSTEVRIGTAIFGPREY